MARGRSPLRPPPLTAVSILAAEGSVRLPVACIGDGAELAVRPKQGELSISSPFYAPALSGRGIARAEPRGARGSRNTVRSQD